MLVKERGILPHSLEINGVKCEERISQTGGGQAEIYKSKLGNEVVALKILRSFKRTDENQFKVSVFHDKGP